MHLLSQNISKQLQYIFKGEFPNATTPFTLTRQQQKMIGDAISESTLITPMGLDGNIMGKPYQISTNEVLLSISFYHVDVFSRPKTARAVDWQEFLLLTIPTLVFENLEQNECESLGPLLGLVSACSIALSWNISTTTSEGEPSDLDRLQRNLDNWHVFMLYHMPTNLYTINEHLLRHLPKIITKLGPPRCFGARGMERAIGKASTKSLCQTNSYYGYLGEIKRQIKLRRAPGANASKVLVKIAARRHYERMHLGDEDKPEAEHQSVFQVGSESNVQLWGPPLRENVSLNDYPREWNIKLYLRKYWARYQSVQPREVEIDETLLRVAPNLYYNNNVYDCLAYQNGRSQKSILVSAMIPVNIYANARRRRNKIVPRRYFGEPVLFFAHAYAGIILPLLCNL